MADGKTLFDEVAGAEHIWKHDPYQDSIKGMLICLCADLLYYPFGGSAAPFAIKPVISASIFLMSASISSRGRGG